MPFGLPLLSSCVCRGEGGSGGFNEIIITITTITVTTIIIQKTVTALFAVQWLGLFWGPTGVQIQPLLLRRARLPRPRDLASLCLSFLLCTVGEILVWAAERLSTRMDTWPRAGHPDSSRGDDPAGAQRGGGGLLGGRPHDLPGRDQHFTDRTCGPE